MHYLNEIKQLPLKNICKKYWGGGEEGREGRKGEAYKVFLDSDVIVC